MVPGPPGAALRIHLGLAEVSVSGPCTARGRGGAGDRNPYIGEGGPSAVLDRGQGRGLRAPSHAPLPGSGTTGCRGAGPDWGLGVP